MAGGFHAPQVKNNRDVNKWLREMKTMQPLLNEWYVTGMKYDDPVEELYGGRTQPEEHSLMVWLIVVLAGTMCVVFIITYCCHGYICSWEKYHGSPYWFSGKKKKTKEKKDVNNYERPRDTKPEIIHVYEDGKRFSESCAIKLDDDCNEKQNGSVVGKKRKESEISSSEKERFLEIPKQKVLQMGFQMRRSLISRLSIRRESHKRRRLRSMPYNGERKESIPMAHASNFSEQPLPPVPNLRLKRAEAMIEAHVKARNNKKSLEEVQKELLSNSFDTLYRCQSTSTRPFNFFQQKNHHLINRTRSNQVSNQTQIMKPLRSMSLDDDYLLHSNKQKNKIRHSRSLDILEENITINTLYAEITDDPRRTTNTEKLLNYPQTLAYNQNHAKPSEKNKYIEIDTTDMRKFAQKNKNKREKPGPENNPYIQINDSTLSSTERRATVSDIQKRPLPKPGEGKLDKQKNRTTQSENRNLTSNNIKLEEHTYCRASVLINEQLKITDQTKNS